MRPISGSALFSVVIQSALTGLFLLMISPIASAQIDRAVLEGTITDATGAVIHGAEVQVLAVDTGIDGEQRSNADGYYRFSGLAVGRYKVTVSNAKFTTKVIDDVILQVGQTRTLNIALQVGAIAEKVEVQ